MKHREFNNILRALAKLVCHSQIEQIELVKYFRFVLIHEARKEFPDHSITQLAHITGIRRGVVTDVLKENEPQRFISKDSMVLSELWRLRDEDDKVPIRGGKNAFYTIAKPILTSSYSPDSCLDALVASESIEYCDEHTNLLINSSTLLINQVSKDMIYYIGYVVGNLVETNLYNRNKLNQDKFFDMTISTSRTSPEKIKLTHQQVKKALNENIWGILKSIIDNNEADVPAGTYPEYSVSIFKHKDKNR